MTLMFMKLHCFRFLTPYILTSSSFDANADDAAWFSIASDKLKLLLTKEVVSLTNLRDNEVKLAIPLARMSNLKNSFCYSGAVLWNGLTRPSFGKRKLSSVFSPVVKISFSDCLNLFVSLYTRIRAGGKQSI